MRGWQVITGAADNWSPAAPSDAVIQSLLPPAASSAAPLQWPPVISTGLGGPHTRNGVPSGSSGAGAAASSQHRALPAASPLGTAFSGLLLPAPEPAPLNLHQGLTFGPTPPGLSLNPEGLPVGDPGANRLMTQLQEARAAEASGGGHSSGHSGGGHVDTASLAHRAEAGEAPHGTEHAHGASAYRLRTRSSSLRAAWVERPVEEAEEAEEEAPAGGDGAASEDAETDGATDSEEEEPPRAVSRKGSKGAGKAAGSKAPTRKRSRAGAKAAAAKAAPAAAAAHEEGDETGDDEEGGAGGKGSQRRLGRPVVYKGDPNAPHLTDAERRKIKRRIANRESARRVRAKRADLMDELQIKVTAQAQQNARLASHAAMLENQCNILLQQNALLQQQMSQKAGENVSLCNQLYLLRRLLPPEVVAQAERDAHAATPPPGSPVPMQGSGLFVPNTPSGCPGGSEDPFGANPSGLPQNMDFL